MTTVFQYDMGGPTNKGSRSSPAPPSIVSMASDMFTAGFVDPEQFVPTSMSDLFEGALCDDEIPSLLNLTPTPGNGGVISNETLQLVSEPQSSSGVGPQQTSGPLPPPPPTATSANIKPQIVVDIVPVLPAPAPATLALAPAPEAIESTPVSPVQRSQKRKVSVCQKQQQPPPPPVVVNNKSNKKIKLSMMPRHHPPVATHMLQAIRPMTELPSSAEVRGGGGGTRLGATNKNGINTSTAHVKALTGANGAAVCLDAIERALQQSGSTTNRTDTSLAANSVDANGKPLSAEEKAKQSRDRNRQHARNTRVRKKAYVEELKRTLNTLVDERDLVLHQRRIEQQGVLEQRDVRYRVIEDFLNLRGRNEGDPNRWSMILEDGFQLRLPRADVPGVVCSTGGNANSTSNNGPCHSYPLGTSKKVLTGVKEVVEDSKMVASLLQSLGASPLSVSYQCDRESFMMDNTNVVINWMATSSGAVTKGAKSEFSIEGSLRARFNPVSNKLLHMEFSF